MKNNIFLNVVAAIFMLCLQDVYSQDLTAPAGVTSQLPFEKIQILLDKLNSVTSTATNLTASALEELFSDKYLRNGVQKPQRVIELTTPGSQYVLGYKASNPKVISCEADGICKISYNESMGKYAGSATQYIIWNPDKDMWQYAGNQISVR